MHDIEYYFFEWLIIEKNISREKFESLNKKELNDLKNEFVDSFQNAIVIKL